MATAILQVAGRRHEVACREGEQVRLEALGRIVDAKARDAAAGMGNLNEVRQLLFAALLLADELEARPAPAIAPSVAAPPGAAAVPAPAPRIAVAPLLGALADHLEAVATRLEKAPADA